MADLNMTFVRLPRTNMTPIFETFPLTVTSHATSNMLEYMGGQHDKPTFINNFEAVGFLHGLQKAIADGKYPAPGCAYLVQDQFAAMFHYTKQGCDLFIHVE